VTARDNEEEPVIEVILQISQLLCFPFAVDTNDELLTNIQRSETVRYVVGYLLIIIGDS